MKTLFTKTNRRSFIITLITYVTFGIPGISTLIRFASAMGIAPKPGMQRIKGEVRINGKPAKIGDLISVGDVVSTGPNSMAIFVVGSDAFLLRAETEIILDWESTKTMKEKAFNYIKMMNGKMLSVFGRGRRRMVTPTAVVGVRGTAAYIEVEPGRTYVCICYGTADLASATKPEIMETVKTTHHESPRYINAKDSSQLIEEAPVINHTDDELIMLEKLVWREPPFLDRETGSY